MWRTGAGRSPAGAAPRSQAARFGGAGVATLTGLLPTDPFDIQPGAIFGERFCVIGRVRHTSDGWRVPVSDVSRRSGAAPHHRLVLHRIAVSNPIAARSVLPAHQFEVSRVIALAEPDAGATHLTFVAAPAEGPALHLPLPEPTAGDLVRTLASILRRCHQAGIAGLRFDLRELRLDREDLHFASWRHLTDLGTADLDARVADVKALAACLIACGAGQAQALVARLEDQGPDESLASLVAACSEPAPDRGGWLLDASRFVGRHRELSTLRARFEDAQRGEVQWVRVTGPTGIGRSRLLTEGVRHLVDQHPIVVHARFGTELATTGVALLVERVTQAIRRLPTTEQEAANAHLQRAKWPGIPPGPDVPLLEQFLGTTGAIADGLAAIGTPDRVLVLCLDDVDRAGEGIREILSNLLATGRRHHTLIVAGESAPVRPREASTREADLLVLEPLSQDEVESWLSGALSGDEVGLVAEGLFRETQGVPGLVWAQAEAWLRPADPGPPTAPDVAQIGACCCVAADSVDAAWLTEVTGWEAARVRSAVASLVQTGSMVQSPAGLLSWRDEPARLRFVAAREQAREAHDLVWRWFERRAPDAVVERAWHLEHARPPGPDEVLAGLHLAAGARQVALANVERAAWHFRSAIERGVERATSGRARRGLARAALWYEGEADAVAICLDTLEQADDDQVASIASEAISVLAHRRATPSILTIADRALARHGSRLPRGWTAAVLQGVGAAASWGLRNLVGRAVTDDSADQLALLHTALVRTLTTSHPHVAFASMILGPSVTALRTSGEAARARAFLAPAFVRIAPERALALLERADAMSCQDPVHHPVVLQLKGQTQWTLGRYAEGRATLSLAVAELRRGGDPAVAVAALATLAHGALDREPTTELLARVDDALAAAWRHRFIPDLESLRCMRTWIRVRAGLSSGDALDRELEGIEAHHPVQGVLADTLMAWSYLRDGRPLRAVEHARRGAGRRDALAIRAPLLDMVRAPLVLGLLLLDHVAEAERELVLLARSAAREPQLKTQYDWCRARCAIHRGRPGVAIGIFADIVSGTSVHGERWWTLAAHRALAELYAGPDPAAVAGHRALAAELAVALGEAPAHREPPPRASERFAPDHRADLAHLLRELRTALAPALPGGVALEVSCPPGLAVPDDVDVFELVIVNLLLAARDGSPLAMGLRVTVTELPVGLRICLDALGAPLCPPTGALAECRDLAATLGGFVECEAELHLTLVLPTTPTAVPPPAPPDAPPVGMAGVLCADERLAQTLVTELVRLGWSATALSPGDPIPPDLTILLVDDALSGELPTTRGRIIPVLPRSARHVEGALRVPFVVRELAVLLAGP